MRITSAGASMLTGSRSAVSRPTSIGAAIRSTATYRAASAPTASAPRTAPPVATSAAPLTAAPVTQPTAPTQPPATSEPVAVSTSGAALTSTATPFHLQPGGGGTGYSLTGSGAGALPSKITDGNPLAAIAAGAGKDAAGWMLPAIGIVVVLFIFMRRN